MVSGPHAVDLVAHGHDDAGALVPQHDRRHRLRPDGLHREVAVADADSPQLDQHLVATRLVQLDLGDLERRLGACRDGGLDPHRTYGMVWSSTYASMPSMPFSRPRPGLLEAAERAGGVEGVLVDRDVAAADPARDVLGVLGVRTPHAAREPVGGVVGDRDRVVGRRRRGSRTPPDRRSPPARSSSRCRRRRRSSARRSSRGRGRAAAAEHEPGALVAAGGDVALDPLALHGADQRADGDVRVRGIADREGADLLAQRLDDLRDSARCGRARASRSCTSGRCCASCSARAPG